MSVIAGQANVSGKVGLSILKGMSKCGQANVCGKVGLIFLKVRANYGIDL